MYYEFFCNKCNKKLSLSFSMKDDDGRNNASCPECGEKLERILSVPFVSIKGRKEVKSNHKMSFVQDGEQVDFGFVDHSRDSGLSGRSFGKRISGSRVDEKTGRLVVDVISNTPDPLGKLNGVNQDKKVSKISTKVKRRK